MSQALSRRAAEIFYYRSTRLLSSRDFDDVRLVDHFHRHMQQTDPIANLTAILGRQMGVFTLVKYFAAMKFRLDSFEHIFQMIFEGKFTAASSKLGVSILAKYHKNMESDAKYHKNMESDANQLIVSTGFILESIDTLRDKDADKATVREMCNMDCFMKGIVDGSQVET